MEKIKRKITNTLRNLEVKIQTEKNTFTNGKQNTIQTHLQV
jgi:hypothetical protein